MGIGNRTFATTTAGLAIVALLVVGQAVHAAAATSAFQDQIELVESWPAETSLDTPDMRDALEVWLELIGGARRTLDLAEFYLSNEPGSRLEQVIAAVEAAADRGVKVRLLAEEKFYKTYPETIERLARRPGIQVQRFDVARHMGGVLHAKYFLVDDEVAYLGSQNFDWRALEHIQELGVCVRVPKVVRALAETFDMDWGLAGGQKQPPRRLEPRGGGGSPTVLVQGADTLVVRPALSPKGWLKDEQTWDLPQLVDLIDAAGQQVRVQLLTYKTVGRDKVYFDQLENALRRASARGVRVQLLLADWSKRKGTIEGLQSLQTLANIDVRLLTIPEASTGFIPFARVAHAKLLVVDGKACWLGTSNWESDYFLQSRNVGVVVTGKAFAGRVDSWFARNWESPYAVEVDPCAAYQAPRIGE
jgi:phosphatidylserine/phosphatidylglycerophosphate/cardiolipin synthase-like enzyme